METTESWKSMFESWPEAVPKQGMLVTKFGETVTFTNFLVSGGILLVQKDKPDSHGARKMMIAYDAISAVKLSDPGELARYQVMGFQASF